jgi:phosphatidylglycerol:prolipoprotein diacylglycerol transferase
MLLLAWGIGWWVARRRARGLGIPAWHIDWLVPLLLISTAVGTRLAGRFCQTLSDGVGNDRVLYGGLSSAVTVGIVYGVAARIPLGRLGDAFAFSLPLGIGLLRIGCFFAGCCWGDVCACPERFAAVDDQAWRRQVQTIPGVCSENWPVCVTFPAGSPAYYQHLTAGLLPPSAERSLPVHPVQLYEMAASLALLGVLLLVDGRLRHWGESFLVFGVGYSVVRFAVEWFRADNQLLAYELTCSQLASIAFACLCVLVWGVRLILAKRRPDRYNRPRS